MSGLTVRRATPADAAELTRLRAEMFAAYGGADPDEGDWEVACTRMLAEQLAGAVPGNPVGVVAFVVDDPDDPSLPGRPCRLLAGGVGWIERHLPGPGNRTGARGHIASMSTVPGARRQGLGRLVLRALLDYFAYHGVSRVDLFAARMGSGLYRSEGFQDAVAPALSWYAPGARLPPWRQPGPGTAERAG